MSNARGYAFFFSNTEAQAEEVKRQGREVVAHDRLERFRWLLARYQHVWHFQPRKDMFIRLWNASETVELAKAEGDRLNGGSTS